MGLGQPLKVGINMQKAFYDLMRKVEILLIIPSSPKGHEGQKLPVEVFASPWLGPLSFYTFYFLRSYNFSENYKSIREFLKLKDLTRRKK